MTMKIREIVREEAAIEAEPAPEEIKAVQDLLGTIDVAVEKPDGLLNKLMGWMKQHPLLDRITDLIPQTRLVKAISNAVDALENNDKMTALNSLASGLTGNVGKAVGQLARGANTATALAQNNLQGAAMAAGGTVGKLAKTAATVDRVQTALAPKPATTATVQAQSDQTGDEVERIKQLSNV